MENYTSDSFYNKEYHRLPQDIRIQNPAKKLKVENDFNKLLYDIITDQRFDYFKFKTTSDIPSDIPKIGLRYSFGINIEYYFDHTSFSTYKNRIKDVNEEFLERIEFVELNQKDKNFSS